MLCECGKGAHQFDADLDEFYEAWRLSMDMGREETHLIADNHDAHDAGRFVTVRQFTGFRVARILE